MGVFMASVAFRCTDSRVWENAKPRIKEMIQQWDALTNNLDSDGQAFAIVSPFGHEGGILAEMAEPISELVNDYAVFATCVDSDFAMLELYQNGEHLESSFIGHVYEEYAELVTIKQPDMDLWRPLLIDQNETDQLELALISKQVFVEDQLCLLTKLTGLPVFDEHLVFEC